jgi:hypothetical protein
MQNGVFLNFVASVLDSTAGRSFGDLWERFFTSIGGDEAQFGTPLEYAIVQAESVAALSPIAHQWTAAFADWRIPAQADRIVELTNNVPRLKVRLAESMILFGESRGVLYLPQYLMLDEDTTAAVEILTDPARYRSLLGSSSDPSAAVDTNRGQKH